MSRYINLNRIEFAVTDACNRWCMYCLSGERLDKNGRLDADAAVISIDRLAKSAVIYLNDYNDEVNSDCDINDVQDYKEWNTKPIDIVIEW